MQKQKRVRVRIKINTYKPEWDGVFVSWTRLYVNQHFWRVRRIYGSKEDAMQECALIFVKCRALYRNTVDNPKWFMSLYQTAVRNSWHDASISDTAIRENIVEYRSIEEIDTRIEDNNLGPIIAQLSSARHEVQDVLTLFANAPAELLNAIFSTKSKAALNRKLLRFAGINKTNNVDVLSALRENLSP